MSDDDFELDPELGLKIAKGLARARAASEALAKQGWTTPLWFVPGDTVELLGTGDPHEVDENFLRLYEEGSEALARLERLLLGHPRLKAWCLVLSQVVTAFCRGDFAVCIPALLMVLEGVLMGDQGDCTAVRSAFRSRASEEDPDSIIGWLWDAAAAFIDELFARASFSGDRPQVINRHWVLHGRDAPDWTRADCLRLMQAIGVIVDLEQRGSLRIPV